MIILTVRMKVFSEKRKELSQTITSLVSLIRKEKGCKRCGFYRSVEDENELSLTEEWESMEDLNRHLQSEIFRVLLGAMNLLKHPQELKIYRDLPANQHVNLAEELNPATG
jgi:quinol monooxygenase YgiN